MDLNARSLVAMPTRAVLINVARGGCVDEPALITPHAAGETCRYEDNVIVILLINLERLRHGEDGLINAVAGTSKNLNGMGIFRDPPELVPHINIKRGGCLLLLTPQLLALFEKNGYPIVQR